MNVSGQSKRRLEQSPFSIKHLEKWLMVSETFSLLCMDMDAIHDCHVNSWQISEENASFLKSAEKMVNCPLNMFRFLRKKRISNIVIALGCQKTQKKYVSSLN